MHKGIKVAENLKYNHVSGTKTQYKCKYVIHLKYNKIPKNYVL